MAKRDPSAPQPESAVRHVRVCVCLCVTQRNALSNKTLPSSSPRQPVTVCKPRNVATLSPGAAAKILMNSPLVAAKALEASGRAVRSLRCLKSLRRLSSGTRRDAQPRSAAASASWAASRLANKFPSAAEMNAGPASTPGSQPTLKHLKSRDKRRTAGAVYALTHTPSWVFLQVVNSGQRGSGPALFLFSDFNRYLFNCGEGVQRVMMEHKLKMSRLDKIFFTRMSWNNVGGLSGMILTMKDINIPECSLFGPPQLERYLEGVNVFAANIHDLKLVVEPCTEMESVDETMAVQQIPILGDDSKADDPSLTVAYLCKLHERKGSFLLTNAKALGLPIGTKDLGPMVTDFKNGKSVVFNGREIRPEEVLTPSDPGPMFLVVECPDASFVSPVTSNAALHRYQAGGDQSRLSLVVHMAPDHVVCHPLYQDWMQRFGDSTEHLLLNERTESLHHLRSLQIQTQLHLVHPRVFPTLHGPGPSPTASEKRPDFKLPLVMGECLLKYQLRPKVTWQRNLLPVLDEEQCRQEAMECAEFAARVGEIEAGSDAAAEGASRWPEVVFLGTGSAMPMKTRNVSATLLRVSAERAVMLDCGEGTLGQLSRHFGGAVDAPLCALRAVFVSHMHADHHTGLINLLLHRERALSALGRPWKPLIVIGPPKIMNWLNIYHEHCQAVLHLLTFIPSQTFLKISQDSEDLPESVHDLYKELDISHFETCYVHHCFNAFGCALTHASGWKVVFSGDTMPCEALISMGKGATLLIHEATLEDGLEEEALEKTHSTTSQAIDVGVRMGAEFTLLNHFSQRYAKIPLIQDLTARVGVTFDHMQVRFSDFSILPKLIPPLKALFAEDIEEMEERKDKRFIRQQHQQHQQQQQQDHQQQKQHQQQDHQQPKQQQQKQQRNQAQQNQSQEEQRKRQQQQKQQQQQDHQQQKQNQSQEEQSKRADASDEPAALPTVETSSEASEQSSVKRSAPTPPGEAASDDEEDGAKRARLAKGGGEGAASPLS
ncbi:zinc phosphodiesterase ELAC protein 2 [Lethenteron reissneri]|uniref:zinc phosphodiesterase ELAC protein 2 n=1 Tax=Lethenteron reissneri TaxID=7753 RepID=UPI002AB608D8|nr:zinc phosphodiesterase ELAC protein 2 [Lethenteron reissneri]